MFVGEETAVVEAGGRVVQGEGVEEGDLDAADAGGFHLFEVAGDLLVGDGGAEPPPAHHDPAGVGRAGKVGAESCVGVGRGLRARGEGEREE